MKVLLISDYGSPSVNGIALRVDNLVRELREKAVAVKFYGPKELRLADASLPSVPNIFSGEGRLSVAVTPSLCRDILSGEYDILHLVYPPCSVGAPLMALAKLRGMRIVCSHHVQLECYGKAYFSWPLRTVLRALAYATCLIPVATAADLVLAPDPENNDFRKILGVDVQRLETRFDIDSFPCCTRDRPKVLGYVGRLAPEKGLDKLIEMFLRAKLDYELHIIGDGPVAGDLRKRYAECGKVLFVGHVDRSELAGRYAGFAAHITCSTTETLGYTLLESMSCGTPILYPKCKLFKDLYGKSFPRQEHGSDANSLRTCVEYLEEHAQDLRERSRRFAQEFSSKSTVISKYAALLERRKRMTPRPGGSRG